MRLKDNNYGFIGFLKNILTGDEDDNTPKTILNKLLTLEEPTERYALLRSSLKKKKLPDHEARIRTLGMLAFELDHLNAHASLFDDEGHNITQGITQFFHDVFTASSNTQALSDLLSQTEPHHRIEIIAALTRSTPQTQFSGLPKFTQLFEGILAERLLQLSESTQTMSLPLLTERYRHILSLLEKTDLYDITAQFIEDESIQLLASDTTLQKGEALLDMLLVEIAWHPLRAGVIDRAITLGASLLRSPDFQQRTHAKTLLILLLKQLRIAEVKALPGDTIKHACLEAFENADPETQDEPTAVLEFLEKRRQEPDRPQVDPKQLPQEFQEDKGGVFGEYL